MTAAAPQTARPSSIEDKKEFVDYTMTEISMTTAVAEALEALLHLRDEHGAITPADIADAVLAHDLDEAETEALALELDAHGAAPELEEEPELDLSIGTRPLHDRFVPDVPQRGRPLPAAHRRGRGRAREAHREGRHGRRRSA